MNALWFSAAAYSRLALGKTAESLSTVAAASFLERLWKGTKMAKRVGLSPKTRFDVFNRDLFTCQYCGSHPPSVVLQVDHIVAVAAGGNNGQDNLVTSCEGCNSGKGARPLSSAPESLAIKAERMRESERQLLGYQEIARSIAERLEQETWDVAERLYPGSKEKGFKQKDLLSIRSFVQKLGFYGVLELADRALAVKPYGGTRLWLYFCGCCWRTIKGDNQ